MTLVKLHVLRTRPDGVQTRRTFLITDDGAGGVDIVDETRPRCEADRSAVLSDRIVLEVEL